MNYHNVSCVFEASGKASPNKQGWDYSLNEAIDVYWSTPRGRAGPAALRALSPKFEIEFGTMTRRASAEGTSIRGVYVEAVQNWSGFLRTGLQRDTTIRPSQDVWNENQGSGKQRCQFHNFTFFFFFLFRIQIQNPVTVQLLLANKVNRLEDFRKVDQANKLAHAATQASDKMANAM